MTLGMAYLAFYVANSPQIAGTSGVIAVVVMGIYGSATGKWDMSPRVAESGFFYRCASDFCDLRSTKKMRETHVSSRICAWKDSHAVTPSNELAV